jgi:hypothetical protein
MNSPEHSHLHLVASDGETITATPRPERKLAKFAIAATQRAIDGAIAGLVAGGIVFGVSEVGHFHPNPYLVASGEALAVGAGMGASGNRRKQPYRSPETTSPSSIPPIPPQGLRIVKN